ncbi:MAG: UDP-N-acetylglucosamine 1-carboxyvinyltransferase [Undibacterium sp.]
MDIFRIKGGKQLSGTIPVYGLKNAATPIIAATLLTSERSVLENMPRIEDVFRILEILESMGVGVEWTGERTVAITPQSFDPNRADQDKVKRLRSSILLLGSLAARFDSFELRQPGGCVIGARPVNTHIKAFEQLDVAIEETEKGYVIDATKRHPGKVVLRQMSVTTTENIMLLASLLDGETIIRVAACEPHIVDLANFLQKMGVEISGAGTHTITIRGKRSLSGATHAIMPDHNEAATFLFLGAMTGSELTIENAREDDLDIVLERLREFGVTFTIEKNTITVHPAEKLRAPAPGTAGMIDTRTYPGIPTEAQSLFGTLATVADGETLIFETMFEGRFNYASELEKMGAKLTILNPHQMVVYGPTPLKGTVIKSFDLRAGVALIIAALAATGETVIEDVYQVDRGYERIEDRLSAIGADIVRETI